MSVSYSVSLEKLINDLKLETIYMPKDPKFIEISTVDVNRPGLQISGYFDLFDKKRLQLLGLSELTCLESFPEERVREFADRFFSHQVPAVIISRNLNCPEPLVMAANKYKVPLLRTVQATCEFMCSLIAELNVELAPRETRHGVLVEVYGEGILLVGESGVGKSETAIELIKRGHRIVADDAVEIRRVSSKSLVGRAPENIRHFIELRGVGIINVARVFGSGAVKMSEKVDLVVELEPWDKTKNYSRTGLETDTTDIMGIQLPCTVIPVMPGRNLAVILEAAAINNRQKKMGYNAARELLARLGLDEDDPSLR